jgi:hypothetical protein
MSDSTRTGQPATEDTQTAGSAPSQSDDHFAARGFWLPGDQTSFFQHEKDSKFREPVHIANDPELNKEALARKNEAIADENQRVPDEKKKKPAVIKNTLEDHVLHRLALVLSQREYGYTHMIPAYHSSNPFGEDPDAAVFVHRTFSAPDLEFEDENGDTITHPLDAQKRVTSHGIALLVNSSGFYLWIMQYRGNGEISEQEMQRLAEAYLEKYVYWIVGGNFASRYSGWKDEADLATEDERKYSLKDYEHDLKGILTFAQINIIFEGLFSSALNFHVFFFDTASDQRTRVNQLRRRYSVGRFIQLVSTPIRRQAYHPHTKYQDPEKQAGDRIDADESTDARKGDVIDQEILDFLANLDHLHPNSSAKSPSGPGHSAQSRGSLQKQAKAIAHLLCFDYLGELGCGLLLRKFLQATAQITLLRLKRRIERSRRALVAEILQVTQRQDPLLQVEVPQAADIGKEPGSEPKTAKPINVTDGAEDEFEEERIPDVNESQLRGYVLLVSAKLPLISNVGVYLDEIAITNNWYKQPSRHRRSDKTGSGRTSAETSENTHEQGKDTSGADNSDSESADTSGSRRTGRETNDEREVTASRALWKTLLRSIEKELAGLEHAIEQERQDRMVQEEEKIRVEQETLAEIERLQDRNSKSLSPRTTFTLAFVSNVFAIASVLVAVFGTNIGQNITHINLDPTNLAELISIILLLALALSALYFLAQYLFFKVGSAALLLLRIPLGNRYYYEMDIHVDAPLDRDADALNELISGRFNKVGRGERLIENIRNSKGAAWKRYRNERVLEGIRFWTRRIWPAFRRTERNSYRVERSGRNEGMHKVYLEVTALLARRHWYQILHPSVHLVLVYEIFFHRPGGEDRYILNDIRVVSTQGHILDAEQLEQIKRIVADYFVNPLIARQSRGTWEILTTSAITPEGHVKREDALMAMTTPQPDGDSSWWSKARPWARGPFTVLMQLGMASAFLFLLRGLLDVVAVAARGGLNALNGFGAIAKAMYFSETWRFLGTISWEWRVILFIIPTVIALLLGLIPALRYRVRNLVRHALDPQPKTTSPGSTSPKNTLWSRVLVFLSHVRLKRSSDTPKAREAARGTDVARSLPDRLILFLWFIGGWSGFLLHYLFMGLKVFVMWAMATVSVVAFLSMIVALLGQRQIPLLFLLP